VVTRLAPAGRRPRARPTRRGLLQLVLGLTLWLAGANVGSTWVVLLSAAAIGAVLTGVATAARAVRRVSVTRELPAIVVAGQPVTAALTVTAPTAARLVVTDDLTGVAADTATGMTLRVPVALRRGAVPGGRVRVGLADRFGLASATAAGEVASAVLALPAVGPTAVPRPRLEAAGVVPSAAGAGAGTEILGVRDYRAGDAPRSVHWRSSARHGRLVVRETAREAGPALVVALAGGSWDAAALDRAAERACGLAAAAEEAGRPVELALDGRRLAWSPAARRDLALLPPHAGAPARPLAPPPLPAGTETVLLTPADPAAPPPGPPAGSPPGAPPAGATAAAGPPGEGGG